MGMQTACLEIHQMNVGQGDAALVVNRDVEAVARRLNERGQFISNRPPIDYVPLAIQRGISLAGTVRHALLIDGGDDEYGDDVVAYLERHGVVDEGTPWAPRLSVLVSHFHDDHMAGLRSVFKKRVERREFDEIRVGLEERYRPGRIYQTAPDAKHDPPTLRFDWLKADIEAATTAVSGWRSELFYLDRGGRLSRPDIMADGEFAPTTIDLGTGIDGIPITLTVYAASQSVYARPTPVDVPSVGRNADQNDRSIVMLLEYGSFRYFFGGDVGGNGQADGGNVGANAMDAAGKRFFSVHADVESRLRTHLVELLPKTTRYEAGKAKFPWDGYATAMKANHHGSSSSNDVYLLSTLRPMLVVFSSGIKTRFHQHPTQAVINRLTRTQTPSWGRPGQATSIPNTVLQIYLTECADRVKGKAFATNLYEARILGDIVIRPIDETVKALQDATEAGQALEVQVYGTGEQTGLEDSKRNALRAVTRADGPYPVGPWVHSDTH